mgnify:CR=1 FL=1
MTLHTETIGLSTIIETGTGTRLAVSRWNTPRGRSLVSITPEYGDRRGEWHLAHSAVSFAPAAAAQVAAAVLEVAASIDEAPVDPTPTEADRDGTRCP